MNQHERIVSGLILDIGLYLNLFQVSGMPRDPIELRSASRSIYTDLRSLREQISKLNKQIWLYADGDIVYGYGKDMDLLQEKGFYITEVELFEVPRLTSRMILDGFIEHIKSYDYLTYETKGRCETYNWNSFQLTSDKNVRLYRGFDLRSLFLRDREINEIVFGLVIDMTCTFRDKDDKPLNTFEIRNRYGSRIYSEVRQIHGDLLPTGRINTEVTRQRLLDHIIPFVSQFPRFQLPCDITVSLNCEPTRIILGGEGI